MNKGPNIVANRWHEVASSLEKTGFFQEDQLNLEDVLRILPDLVRRYTAVLGYVAEGELTPIGSGTFLRRKDGQCGILTAGHVVGAIKNKESIRVLPTQDREEVDWIGIEGMGMHGWGETNTGLKGPDIGWMPLSAKEAASIESLGGVFHNRRRTMEDFSGEVCQISVAFGFVDAASSPSDKKIVAHPMIVGVPLEPGVGGMGGEYDIDAEGVDGGGPDPIGDGVVADGAGAVDAASPAGVCGVKAFGDLLGEGPGIGPAGGVVADLGGDLARHRP